MSYFSDKVNYLLRAKHSSPYLLITNQRVKHGSQVAARSTCRFLILCLFRDFDEHLQVFNGFLDLSLTVRQT